MPLRGAQGRAGFGGRLKGADVLVRSFGPLFVQVRVRLVFSEVWPGGAQRSSQSTCRTDRAELYPRSTFWGMPLHPSCNTIVKANR